MDFQNKNFDRLIALTEENNKLIKKMLRSARLGHVMRILYWLVLIGISIGAFYFIQPYLEQLISVYAGLNEGVSSLQSFIGN